MPSWHAYADHPELRSGTQLLVTGGTMAVRLLTGDTIVVELPDTNRLTAIVIDRTGEHLTLAIHGGGACGLHAVDESSAGLKLSDGFSRQSWAVD